MQVIKLGHSCLHIQVKSTRILIDPGMYTTGFEHMTDLDAILLTHEHQDHLEMRFLHMAVGSNPATKIYTHESLVRKLAKEGFAATVVKEGETVDIKGVPVRVFGSKHAMMHAQIPQIDNVGYLIAGELFHPGDALTLPNQPIKVLALPVAAPWLKLSEAIDYAVAVKPTFVFPIHDGILNNIGSTNILPPKVLEPVGIEYKVLKQGEIYEF